LTLKTYDPVSGAVIKFRTGKIADVGRLIAGLHRLAREQTGLPPMVETGTYRGVDGEEFGGVEREWGGAGENWADRLVL
jgi:hypothetical protein